MAQGIELFKAFASLVLDKSGFDKDIKSADSEGKNLAEKMQGYFKKVQDVLKNSVIVIGAVKGAQAIWNLAKSTSAAGDKIDKQSQALGMSRKAYQEWDYILGQSGASIDSLGISMKTLQSAISSNSAETASALSSLGLSAAHLQSLSPEDQFEAIVKALQKMPEGTKKSELAMQLLGKNAQSLMPLLNTSADEMEELRKRASDLGLIMSDEDVDASVAFGDALDDLTKTWTALKQKFGGQMLPTFTKGLVAAANALGRVTNAVMNAFKTGDWSKVFETITEEIKTLLPGLIDTVINVLMGVIENADKIIGLAISIVDGLVVGLVKAVPRLVAKLPAIFKSVVDGVKNLFSTLLATIFGVNGDGGIKWPTWSDVRDAATRAWRAIKEGLAGLVNSVGKFVFGERDDGAVDWPTWAELGVKAREAFDGIVKGLANLLTSIGKFIFGERDDGAVEWPTWDDVQSFAQEAWQSIIDGLSGLGTALGAFVFGVRDDGSVKWPTWKDVQKTAEDAWRGIKNGLANLVVTIGKFVFGEKDEDSLNWLETIKSWLDGTGLHGIWINFNARLASWFGRILEWFGLKGDESDKDKVTIGFAANMLSNWFNTILKWLGFKGDGSDEESAKISFGIGSVADWIKTVAEWLQNGIDLIVNFFVGQKVNAKDAILGELNGDTEESNSITLGLPEGFELPGFAKGLNYVPNDGLYKLHQGETILNQNQGRNWRQNGGNGLDMDKLYNAVAGAVGAAIAGIGVEMDSVTVGNLVTKQVSRNLYQAQLGRRFG